jgi:hypothetical protein
MTKKVLTGLGVVLFSLLTALPIRAQEQATLVLRNGERPSGELIDLGAGGFAMRVGGQDRQFSANDVASVEFVGGELPAAAQARVNAGQPLVLLRNGQVIEGRLSDIGGRRPLRLTVDTPSGQRDFTSGDVAQVHLHPRSGSAGLAAATQEPVIPAGAITVAANQPWTDTGVSVRRGDLLIFTATGNVNFATGAGASSGVGGSPAATNPSMNYPLKSAYVGALIGRVGSGAPFLIGANTSAIAMPASGRLMLAVNDDHHADNSGAYSVAIQVAGSSGSSGGLIRRRR